MRTDWQILKFSNFGYPSFDYARAKASSLLLSIYAIRFRDCRILLMKTISLFINGIKVSVPKKISEFKVFGISCNNKYYYFLILFISLLLHIYIFLILTWDIFLF